MISEYQIVSPTIDKDASTSSAFACGEFNKGAVQMPSPFSSSTFWLEVSLDGAAWTRLNNSNGAEVSEKPCAASESCQLPAEAFNYKWARVRTSGGESAARVLLVFLKS